ncbi:MAG: hypothetical protein AAGD25_40570 [Cyanobacteria bacterium P01_F01_bin.150]
MLFAPFFAHPLKERGDDVVCPNSNGESFLNIISRRDQLDSFRLFAQNKQDNLKNLEIIFDQREAKISLKASPSESEWFKHFQLDLQEAILPPSMAQLATHRYGQGNLTFTFGLLAVPNLTLSSSVPYCRILLRRKALNPFIESVKAGIIANFFWLIITTSFGVIGGYILRVIMEK